MRKATNDNDTWTRISLAALRVLTQIEKTEEKFTRENQEAREEKNNPEHERECDTRDTIVVIERKRSA